MLRRRDILCAAGGAALGALAPAITASAETAFGGEAFAEAVRAAEALGAGRLGVGVLDTETGARFTWRGDELFPLASTFKLVLAAAVLAILEAGRERLDRRLPITASDMVPHAPVTGQHIGPEGLTVEALCAATMVWSDNPAANLLLPLVGGPAGLTAFARGLGDARFRLDRTETALNEAIPGDPRDTTTPGAMLGTLDRLLTGTALAPPSRALLTEWLIACRTGDARLRAGLPGGWRCGDKTGTGGHGTTNDVAILWPPARRPILVAAYLTGTGASPGTRDAALAALGRGVVEAVAGTR